MEDDPTCEDIILVADADDAKSNDSTGPPSEDAVEMESMDTRCGYEDALMMDAEVMATTARLGLPLWATVVADLAHTLIPGESILKSGRPLNMFHDCMGIGGSAEGWRWLRAAGVVLSAPITQAACEMDPAARVFVLNAHPWPHVFFENMCDRVDGRSRDILTDSLVQVPSSDLYECGFPCQPFSCRRCSKTKIFAEEKAKPYYQVLEEIKSGRHHALMLENVMGCYTRYLSMDGRVRRVIDIIEEDLRQASQHNYFICITPDVSPHRFGELCHRPRVIFRLLRKSRALVSSDGEFCMRLHEIDSTVATRCAERAARQPAHQSFTKYLEHLGISPIDVDMEEPEVAAATPCPCTQAIRAESPMCITHKCKCRECAKQPPQPCVWRKKHAPYWLKYGRFHTGSYIARAAARQLPVHITFRSSRQLNMAEIAACHVLSLGQTVWTSDAVYDSTQNVGFWALRADGLLPTITTAANLVVLRWGRSLTPLELFALMGFPLPLARWADGLFSQTELRRFIGNTVHPCVAAISSFGLLSLMKAERMYG